jgi:hypothetical protein
MLDHVADHRREREQPERQRHGRDRGNAQRLHGLHQAASVDRNAVRIREDAAQHGQDRAAHRTGERQQD